MEQNEIKEYRLLYVDGGEIKDNGTRFDTLEQLRADFSGNEKTQWAILPAEEVPDNWRDMMIVDGALVPAPASTLEARQIARKAAELEAVRAARESRYRTETDTLMLDAIEAYAQAHPDESAFAAWLAAKDRIRTELPKPAAAEQELGE